MSSFLARPLCTANVLVRVNHLIPKNASLTIFCFSVCFNINDQRDNVVRIGLRSTVYAPGTPVAGICDFSDCDVMCYSLTVLLVHDEVLDPSVSANPLTRTSHQKVLNEVKLLTSCAMVVPFMLPLPHDACHEFETPEGKHLKRFNYLFIFLSFYFGFYYSIVKMVVNV